MTYLFLYPERLSFFSFFKYSDAIHTKMAAHLSLILFCMDTEGSKLACSASLKAGTGLKEVCHTHGHDTINLPAAPPIYRANSTVFLPPISSGMCNRSFMRFEEYFKVWR